MSFYRQLVKKANDSLTERHLHILWLEQKHFHPLSTAEGEEIQVISPGIWNKQAGPDFLKAHLRIGHQDYRGDIEIHLTDREWVQHQHHLDPRYNRVILHVSYEKPVSSFPIYKENGQAALRSYLGERLTLSLEAFLSSIDLDLYLNQEFASIGHCASHLFAHLSEKEIRSLFQSAAYWRLDKKLRYLEHHFPNKMSLQFAGGLAMALGYRQNAAAFLELFSALLPYRDLPYEECLSLALGCCGFLEERRHKHWESSDYYQLLRSLWGGHRSEMTHQASLKLGHIRPLHHPIRRLAYLVHFLQDRRLESFGQTLHSIWEKWVEKKEPDVREFKKQLLQFFPNYSHPHWDDHFTFEQTAQSKNLPGLGTDLKMQMILNLCLPLLYGGIKDLKPEAKEWSFFQQFYTSLLVSETSKSRYLSHRFFGRDGVKDLFSEAQMVQGAYQLHQDFCDHFETSCQGCPFVERYRNL